MVSSIYIYILIPIIGDYYIYVILIYFICLDIINILTLMSFFLKKKNNIYIYDPKMMLYTYASWFQHLQQQSQLCSLCYYTKIS